MFVVPLVGCFVILSSNISYPRCVGGIAPGFLIILIHYKGDPVGECVIEPSDWRFAYLTCEYASRL